MITYFSTLMMNPEEFQEYVTQAPWRFAKSVPNWPHFYIVEQELEDIEAFHFARSFIIEQGREGRFFNAKVIYYDLDGWTYWASPLAEPCESKYMLNRCKTEFTYEALAQAGKLPPEGFKEGFFDLSAVLGDPHFEALVRNARTDQFSVFDVLGTADYEIRHSNVLSWLLNPKGNHGQGALFLRLLLNYIVVPQDLQLPAGAIDGLHVDREGSNEDEKIDLLLLDQNRTWLIVIENKLFSPETGDQLDRYYKYIENRYSDISNRIYFYLTPYGISPQREQDALAWVPIGYQAIKNAVADFLKQTLPNRIEDFLRQYLEHIERNVLKNTSITEGMREILRSYPKIFHALQYVLDTEAVQGQCSDIEINLLRSILAVQQDVDTELFEFTKRMITHHGFRRFSGLGHWVAIEIPELKQRLIELGLLSENETSPFVFTFCSTPHRYYVEIWIYKKTRIYPTIKACLECFSEEKPILHHGSKHLLQVLFRRMLISPEKILQLSIAELKQIISDYFASTLKQDLAEGLKHIEAFATQGTATAPIQHPPA
jgi:hypothetical protein